MCAKVCVIDFAVTPNGLEEQLLDAVICKEKTDLQVSLSLIEYTKEITIRSKKYGDFFFFKSLFIFCFYMNKLKKADRLRLMETVSQGEKRTKDLANALLDRLSSAKSDLIEDTALVEVLQNTKHTAGEVAKQLENSMLAKKAINVAREEYRIIASSATILYFVIEQLVKLSPVYLIPLHQFLKKFEEAIDLAPTSNTISKRLEFIKISVFRHISSFVTRGILFIFLFSVLD